MTDTIAFIGTGLIGAGFAEAALARGDEVRAWNRTTSKAQALETLGATAHDTAGAAVSGASRIHITMTSDAAVDDVLAVVMQSRDAHSVIVDHSTTSPAGTAARAAKCEAEGVPYVHAPIFMSPNACRTAQGLMLASGPATAFAQVDAALTAMTGELWYLGDDPAAAATLKLAGNAMIVSIVAGLADAFAVAQSGDMPAARVIELFQRFDPRGLFNVRGANMARGDYTTHWSVQMAHKDVGLMRETTDVLALLPTIAARLGQLIDRGDGGRDIGALAMDVVQPMDASD